MGAPTDLNGATKAPDSPALPSGDLVTSDASGDRPAQRPGRFADTRFARKAAVLCSALRAWQTDPKAGGLRERWSRFHGTRPRLATWLAEAWGPLLVLAFATWKYAPVSLGVMPVGRDHTVHLFKAWLTEDVLSRGAVIGWSHLFDSGYPVNQFYPPGGSLWVLLVRAATSNLASREAAYAVAVFLACALLPLGLYAVARRPLGRAGAIVAGILSAAEVGAWYQGGWHFSIHWGVWGTSFAVGLGFLATALLVRAVRTGSTASLLGAGLLGAATVLAHPFGLLSLALAAPLRLLQLRALPDLPGDPVPPLGPLLLRAAAFAVLAFAGCAFWLVPYVARAQAWALPYGEAWMPLGTLIKGLFDGTTLPGIPAGWIVAGLVGPVIALAAGRRLGAYLLALFVAAAVVGSSTGLRELGLGLFFPSFEEVQGERFAYVMRAALWLGVGAGVAGILDLARRAAGRLSPGGSRWVTAAAAVVALGLVASPAGSWIRTPFPSVPLASTDRHHAAVKDAAAWLREHTAGDPFFRVLVHVPRGYTHGLLLVAPLAGVAVAKPGFHAAETFRHLGAGLEPDELAAQNVRYVVTATPIVRNDLVRRAAFRPLVIYEFTGYRPERAEIVGGPGTLRIDRIESDELAVTVADAEPGARVRFHVAPYATWKATVNGQIVPWHGGRVGNAAVLDVPAQDGSVVIRIVPRSLDRLGQTLTGLALLVVLAWAVGSRERFRPFRERLAARLSAPAALVARWTPAVFITLALLAAGAVAARAAGVGRPWNIRDRLGTGALTVAGEPCPHRGLAGGFVCGDRLGNPAVYRGTLGVNGRSTRCVIVTPSPRGSTELSFDVPLGARLAGFVANDAPEVTVEIDGVPPVMLGRQPFSIDTSAFAGETRRVRFLLGAGGEKRSTPFCLQARVEAAEGGPR